MTSLFSIGGLSSGLDTKSIIDALMQVERQPLVTLQARETAIQARQKAYQDLAAKFASLQAAASALTLQSNLLAKSATASNPGVLSASAGSAAVNGTFNVTVTQLATATTVSSASPLSGGLNLNVPLAQAGFYTPPTAGTFTLRTVNGGTTSSATITIDANTVLSDGVDDASSNSIIGKINSSGLGITASIVNDAAGHPNYIKLTTSAGVQLQMGSGSDTSNFLTAAGLTNAVITTTASGDSVQSFSTLSTANITATLTSPATRLVTPISGLDASNNGAFTINGVTISYSATDSITSVLGKINASSAGVTATYDPLSDKITLQSTKTGSTTISLQDAQGNFLAATGLLNASQNLGKNALYSIDTVNGGQPLSSPTNTISGVIPGVTLTLTSTSATPVAVTVSPNADATVSAVKNFINAYNDAMNLLNQDTAIDPSGKNSGILSGDTSLFDLAASLRQQIVGLAVGATNPQSLGDIGISFGAVGSAVGTTNTLQLDETKLRAQIAQNPNAVMAVLGGFSSTAALSGTGSIASISGTPSTVHQSGTYQITTAADGTITAVFTPTGGVAGPPVTGTISANGINGSLIPGITLTAGPTLVASTQTITVNVQQRGVMIGVNDFLLSTNGSSGLFQTYQDSANDEIKSLDDQINTMNELLDQKQADLERKFADLEVTLAQIQSQGNSLIAALAGAAPVSSLSSSSSSSSSSSH